MMKILQKSPWRLWGVWVVLCTWSTANAYKYAPPLEEKKIGQALDTSDWEAKDLSVFVQLGSTWHTARAVHVNPFEKGHLEFDSGKGLIVNRVSENEHGKDLYSKAEFGDIYLELEYLMAAGSNAGIYLQGRYEIQLLDSWTVSNPTSGDNGGLYERWDESQPQGQKGYGGVPPVMNASKAPGLWQKLTLQFRAPRFDAQGNKIDNAQLNEVRLNGALIHDSIDITGPTRGSMAALESALGPLRIQGDHGSFAIRQLKIKSVSTAKEEKRRKVEPIYVHYEDQNVLRSFMNAEHQYKVTRAVSVASSQGIHYTYDLDFGSAFQFWRGQFLETTPMWHSRGNGFARPNGGLTRTGIPMLSVAPLPDPFDEWPIDTVGTGFRPLGYRMDASGFPTFTFQLYDKTCTDYLKPLEKGMGWMRQISIEGQPKHFYHLLAMDESITKISDQLYLIGDHSFYIQLIDTNVSEPRIISSQGKSALVVPLDSSYSYQILF